MRKQGNSIILINIKRTQTQTLERQGKMDARYAGFPITKGTQNSTSRLEILYQLQLVT
jgi:hypothetical protein